MKIRICILIILILSGCWQEQIKEEVKTVDWYKDNPVAMAEKLKECSNNPGQFENLPNCKNAQKAKMLLMAEKPASNW